MKSFKEDIKYESYCVTNDLFRKIVSDVRYPTTLSQHLILRIIKTKIKNEVAKTNYKF